MWEQEPHTKLLQVVKDCGYTHGLAILHGLTLDFTILIFQEGTDRKINLMLDTRTALRLLCKHFSYTFYCF